VTGRVKQYPSAAELQAWTLAQLVGNAHQVILNAPRKKDKADYEAMRILEVAYARLGGVR